MAAKDQRLQFASAAVSRVLQLAFKLYDEDGQPIPVESGDPLPAITALAVLRTLDAQEMSMTDAEKLLGEIKELRGEVDQGLKDAIDDAIRVANALVVYWTVRWSVKRHGGPKWAGINLGRVAAGVAMSPSRKPLATKLRENVERALKDRKDRR